jgi:hypothetical protein
MCSLIFHTHKDVYDTIGELPTVRDSFFTRIMRIIQTVVKEFTWGAAVYVEIKKDFEILSKGSSVIESAQVRTSSAQS